MRLLLAKIFAYRIFSEFIVLYPLYTVMFAERGHLDTLQISTLLGIWSVIILCFEVPSGALADKYSRRILLGLAQIIRAIGYATWVFMPNYLGFLIGLGLWGIGRSLTSGTFEALVFDELKSTGKEKAYIKIIGRVESLALFFGLGATLLAAPVFAWLGYIGILWFSVAATLVAAAIVFTLPDKKKQQGVETPEYLKIIRDASREVARNNTLLKLILFGVFVGVLFRIFDEYASLILKAADVRTALIPVVSALVFLPIIVADFYAYRLEKTRQVVFMILLILAGSALVLAGVYLGPYGIICFAVSMLLIKITITVFGAKVQHAIEGSTRATILSINSFGVEIGAVMAFIVYGITSQNKGTSGALVLFGMAAALTGVAYLLFTRGRLVVSKNKN